MARITNFLKLFLPEADDVYNVEKDQNENFEKIDTKLKEWNTGKENTITKKTGFNLDKTNLTENDSNKLFTAKGALDLLNNLTTAISTAVEAAKTALRVDITKKIDKTSKSDAVNSTSSETVATSLAVKTAYDKGVAALTEAQKKENSFTKNTAFNKNFGTTAGTVLEGNKIDQITGKTYGGILNTAGTKVAGKTYFDNNTKKLFLCKNNNSDTSANVNNYIALDNNSLLDRLENLINRKKIHTVDYNRKNANLTHTITLENVMLLGLHINVWTNGGKTTNSTIAWIPYINGIHITGDPQFNEGYKVIINNRSVTISVAKENAGIDLLSIYEVGF